LRSSSLTPTDAKIDRPVISTVTTVSEPGSSSSSSS